MQSKPDTNESDWELQAPANLGAPFPGSGHDYGVLGTRGVAASTGFLVVIGLLLLAYGAVRNDGAWQIAGGLLTVMSLALVFYFVRKESRRARQNPPGQVAEYLVRTRRGRSR